MTFSVTTGKTPHGSLAPQQKNKALEDDTASSTTKVNDNLSLSRAATKPENTETAKMQSSAAPVELDAESATQKLQVIKNYILDNNSTGIAVQANTTAETASELL